MVYDPKPASIILSLFYQDDVPINITNMNSMLPMLLGIRSRYVGQKAEVDRVHAMLLCPGFDCLVI